MDFFKVGVKQTKTKVEIYPDFTVGRSKDLMVRGKAFYGVWDEERNIWSTDEYDVQRLVDSELRRHANGDESETVVVHYLETFNNNYWVKYRNLLRNITDNSHQLDENLTFANQVTKKTDYVSKSLPYELKEGDISAWDELVGTLYAPDERAKIEWAIGAVVAGDSKKLQKFLVFFGPGGTGKSTILNVIHKLFDGYVASFDAKALSSGNGTFATEVFKNNPLVAIQHDGDLSRIEDNTKLNSIIAHEHMSINEKYKALYETRINAFLFMGTNQPVRISDARSGIIRRLIDVRPTGVHIDSNHYHFLLSKIDFELGAIAQHCLDTYRKMGKNFYNGYRPVEMMFHTDIFFNFIEAYYDVFSSQDGITLKQAYSLYKEYCNESNLQRIMPMYKFREELRNYFDKFHEKVSINNVVYRSYFQEFNAEKFKIQDKEDLSFSLALDEKVSLLDEMLAAQPAQGAKEDETPLKGWHYVKTTLADIDTKKLHFVRMPLNHIVIDFDLKDERGRKSLEQNMAAASIWPPTYGELSKSGTGVHLHYEYEGDPSELALEYSPGIEVKVFTGNSSLRRKLTRCNNVPVASIGNVLPIKEKKMLPVNTIKTEKGLRDLIGRNLRKEIHPGTKPSIDFIKKILDEAYDSGMAYDLTDLRARIIAFANNSTNQPLQSLKVVQQMKFKSEDREIKTEQGTDERLVFFDVEVYPNLFVICWKYEDVDTVVKMINPSPQDVEALFQLKLIGFNNRRYDNHILYARYMGYSNEDLFRLSQKLIAGDQNALFGEAFNISYTDIFDFSSKKQTLKKFEIELGVRHMELDLPWDEPVDEKDWFRVIEYCSNDVIANEVTFEARRQDFVARQILAELSGLTVNDTTQKHTAKIIFGNDKRPQSSFVYTDLSKEFPGYVYDGGKSSYRGEDPSEGGYVYAEPGIYQAVAHLDIASMHPTSIEQLNLFGDEYTKNFSALKNARMAIKHRDFTSAKKMLGGKLAPFLNNLEDAEALAFALKIVINIVYGLTSAKFDNAFRDVRNKDNIVAKRGALFMIDLKHAVQEQGWTVAHIKTDSIKIPNATQEMIDFVTAFGQKYGYDFEHEATYDRLCLINDAVYVAHRAGDGWVAVGAQFQQPYVFKTLFSHEPIEFEDYCETKEVRQGVMFLDFDFVQKPMYEYKGRHFVGRTGRFVPVTKESGGGVLQRVKDDKSFAVTGTKGYFWVEAEVARELGAKVEIDMAYFDHLTDDAIKAINKFGDSKSFIEEW